MRVVDDAVLMPQRCAVLGGRGGRFVDTLRKGEPGRVYVSEDAVRELLRVLGWGTPEDFVGLQERFDVLLGEVEGLRERVVEGERFKECVEYTLGQFGERVRKRPGRPKKVVDSEGDV